MGDEDIRRKYLTLASAGALASLSVRTLRRAIVRGELRAHRVGRLVRIDERDLVHWIERGTSRNSTRVSVR
jgi:excisionase family DNA binding protein